MQCIVEKINQDNCKKIKIKIYVDLVLKIMYEVENNKFLKFKFNYHRNKLVG